MGKPTGFLEIKRELPADRPSQERIRDWKEFHLHLPVEKLQEQGARCMDCGVPFWPHGHPAQRHGLGLPDQQPDSRMERSRVSRAVERSAGAAA